MASLYTEQSRNVRRTFFLMGIFLLFVILIGWFAARYFNSSLILYVVVAIAIALNVTAYWKSDTLTIRLTKARPITRKTHFDYWNAVENLCIRVNAPMPKLYIIDDPSPNAFATGRSPKHSAIVVTQGLLDVMEKPEMEGVVAHELAHIQNRDTLLMTAIVVLVGFVAIILDAILHHALLFGGDDEEDGGLLMIVALIAMYIFLPLLLTVIRLAVSRKREFLADATAGIYTRHPEALASALERIQNAHQPMKNAKSATAHLFIADPFAVSHAASQRGESRVGAGILRLFDTHPPVADRVSALLGKG